MRQKISIILIENSYLLRSGMDELFKEFNGIHLSEMFDGTEKNLIQKINKLKPDYVIINPEAILNSINNFVLSINNETIKIGLISDKTPEHIKSRFQNFINKDHGKHELMNSISRIVGHKNSKNPINRNQSLTKREITILKHITLGLTNHEVAGKLFISIHTVMTHRKNITKKLGIKTVSGLTVYALLNKIIEIQDIDQ